jgi:hypothetical protein
MLKSVCSVGQLKAGQEKTKCTVGTIKNFHKTVTIAKKTVGNKVIHTNTFSLTNDCMV